MQRVTNCFLHDTKDVLLLQKPSRNWWVPPGGKMESGESVRDAVVREYREETGLSLLHPALRGIFTFLVMDERHLLSEWMMFSFEARSSRGRVLDQSPEGKLELVPVERTAGLPMAEGDRAIFRHVLEDTGILYGTFHYDRDFHLLHSRFDKEEL
ncbi:NUDIX hydrolase [Salibacterium halotolerans]|uniref:8-oxo-dGTP diphosphatase n=1 Tax=Salibacterium halotolerans TaxID=1884432 RepID=A0A1I5VQZ0_9BACI|nr:8-oxo-dGTP diphosphatase [Salibacterium halotolerans]SFQ09860.1 8-oxo-dGTP diphosphatase [Salibacterium halotolerans]